MNDLDLPFTVAIVVITRDRYENIAVRLPLWAHAGFDETLVVDGSYNPKVRDKIRALCELHRTRYVPAPQRIRDTRALSRNLGAKAARTTWVLFQDDDDDAIVAIHKDSLRQVARGKDWLAGPKGEIIVWHRREAFLAFGGYPPDMVASEDWIMSNRARCSGVGALEPKWFSGEVKFPTPREDPISRARNAFWYGYTLMLFLVRCPKRPDVILGDARRIAKQLTAAPRRPRTLVYLSLGLIARGLSPFHCLGVFLRSGKKALRQEPYCGWQGLRVEP